MYSISWINSSISANSLPEQEERASGPEGGHKAPLMKTPHRSIHHSCLLDGCISTRMSTEIRRPCRISTRVNNSVLQRRLQKLRDYTPAGLSPPRCHSFSRKAARDLKVWFHWQKKSLCFKTRPHLNKHHITDLSHFGYGILFIFNND